MKDENAIIQNLKDAGCDSSTITAIMQDFRDNKIAEGLKLLETHRCLLLEDIQKYQK